MLVTLLFGEVLNTDIHNLGHQARKVRIITIQLICKLRECSVIKGEEQKEALKYVGALSANTNNAWVLWTGEGKDKNLYVVQE